MSDNGDVVSIYSANKLADDRYSVNNKLMKLPIESNGPNVTVTVDGFGAIVTTVIQEMPEHNKTEGEDEGENEEETGEEAQTRTQTETQTVNRYTFRNRNQMTVQVITYGATITAMMVPDKYGHPEDVAMGFDNLQGYLDAANPQFGCTIGRCCNRISDGRFCLNGNTFQLSQNDANGKHHLNGGWQGFDKFLWTPHLNDTVLTMTHVSEFGSEGYPGSVMARATFELKNDNTFHVAYAATTSWPTPLNLSNNMYFNLAGHGAGHQELYKHVVTLNADRVVCVDDERLPTGRIQCVGGTINDLRVPHEIGPAISRCPYGGYDEYMCLIQGTEQDLTFGCRIVHPGSGRVLEVYTDQPGFQFYTGNRLPDPFDNINPIEVYTQDYFEIPGTTTGRMSHLTNSTSGPMRHRVTTDGLLSADGSVLEGNPILLEEECPGEIEEEQSCHCTESSPCTCSDLDEPIVGKHGATYLRHGGFCVNTQKYPDAVNVTNFPDIILYPGQMYKHEIVYKFGLYMGGYKRPIAMEEEDQEGEEEFDVE